MTEEDVKEYVLLKYAHLFAENPDLSVKEIGDGNLNYVYRVRNENDGKSIIIKHATEQIRMNKAEFSTDRSRIETEVLKFEGQLAPGYVPEVYDYDDVMCCVLMEDLFDYKNLRYELVAHHIYPTLADDIATFMADTLIKSTDLVIDPAEKKGLVVKFINPSLCGLTENAIYTGPYFYNEERNFDGLINQSFMERELYNDDKIHLEVAKLLQDFKCKAQSLLHGDLHTGSIFVKEGKTMVLDPEFGYYGPAGFDVGQVISHLIFAWVNSYYTADKEKDAEYIQWLEDTIVQTVDLFREKSIKILEEESIGRLEKAPGFNEWFVDDILEDTAGVTGAELMRRLAGKKGGVRDLNSIEDPERKSAAQRLCVFIAKEIIFNRTSKYKSGKDYIDTIHSVVKERGDEI